MNAEHTIPPDTALTDSLISHMTRAAGMLSFVRFSFSHCSDLQAARHRIAPQTVHTLEIPHRDVRGMVETLEAAEEALESAQKAIQLLMCGGAA